MIVKDKEPMFEEIESSQTVTIGGVGEGHVQGSWHDVGQRQHAWHYMPHILFTLLQ